MSNQQSSRIRLCVEDICRHLRLALRVFRKQPTFAFAVTLLLAFGIGSVTAVFGIMNELMFKPRFGAGSGHLFAVCIRDDKGKHSPFHVSPPYFEEYTRSNDKSFTIFGFALLQPKLRWDERIERTKVELVSGNYFGVLGLRPLVGRLLDTADDHDRGGGRVAVISERLWRQRFNSASEIIGQSLEINGHKLTIVGVAPPGFHGLDTWNSEIWLPTTAEPLLKEFTIYRMALRKGPNASMPEVTSKLSSVTKEIVAKYNSKSPPGYENHGAINANAKITLLSAARGRLSPFADHDEIWRSFWLYIAIVVGVLIIACANITNLMLVRTLQRQREMAIRVALGANWPVLLRHAMAEVFVFAVLGAGIGILISYWLNRALLIWSPPEARFMAEITLNMMVFGFAFLLSIVAALIFGLAPVFYAFRQRLFDSLRAQPGSAGASSFAVLQGWSVVGQIAICVVLLTCTSLCFRSFNRVASVTPGFQTENLLVFSMDLEPAGYEKAIAGVHVNELVQLLGRLPNAEKTTFAKSLPLSGQRSFFGIYNLEGYQKRPGEESIKITRSEVGPNYFAAMSIPLLNGREMTEKDRPSSKPVLVVNESFLRRYWPNINPIGRQIFGFEVVAVARDCRNFNLWEPPEPHLYFQSTEPVSLNPSFIIRTSMDPARHVGVLRAAVASYNSNIKVSDITTGTDLIRRSLAHREFALQVFGCLTVIALVLSAIGTYGLMSYLVSRRAHEIGVRMALGAEKKDILWLVMRKGSMLGLTGLGVGLVGAMTATRLIGRWLYEVSRFDITAVALTCLLMLATAMLASFLPARRATNVDPMRALRVE